MADMRSVPITIAYGDGVGPEIMDATMKIITGAGASIATEEIEVGGKVFAKGLNVGIEPQSWESLRRTKVLLKGPVTTPQGGGFQSLNVTIRKALGLYANVRPCVTYDPFLKTTYPGMDLVVVRENEEDLYGGVEYRLSDEVVESIKFASRPGCEKIMRYAFEYARQNNRKKVTCFSKDNIMKFTDGLFHKTFDAVAAEYSDIANEHYIVDIGAARLATRPLDFDVIVMPNLYGDILSDVAAEMTGSVGLAGSANIGESCSMFEAIHGSAPKIAGQNIANPSGLLLASVMMLVHIGQTDVAERVHNAWLKTIEDGVHTPDIFTDGTSRAKVGTKEFAQAVLERLGESPKTLKLVSYRNTAPQAGLKAAAREPQVRKDMVGIDVYAQFSGGRAEDLAQLIKGCELEELKLSAIYNRGVRVWPGGFAETFCTDSWCCRFKRIEGKSITHDTAVKLLGRLASKGLDFVKAQCLNEFESKKGFSGE